MKKTVFIPGYFGPVDQWVALLNTDEVIWENDDNYQKQTYRTRQYIYGANGKLMLNIPIVHAAVKGEKQKYKTVKIDNSAAWQKQHWKSLESAYRTSPFFEFYEDELIVLFKQPFNLLRAFNIKCWSVITTCLQLDLSVSETTTYQQHYSDTEILDARSYTVAKRKPLYNIKPYFQVFQEKHGFLPNLSILDLLFNKGPQTIAYLQNIPQA